MDELLIGYLLNSLDDDEVRQVEERLQRDPSWHDRLNALQRTLAPLALDTAPEPPPTLVVSTLARIAEYDSRAAAVKALRPVTSGDSTPRSWFRRADVVAAAVLLIVLGAIGAPWLVRQWHQSQVRACEHNLMVFWTGLRFHSDMHDGAFPQLEEEGPCSFAGIVVPTLEEKKLLGHEATVLCPALGRREPDGRTIHDLQLLWEQSNPDEYRAVIREVGGSYAYTLGYRDGERLVGMTFGAGDDRPIMADAPRGCGNSPNHGGMGQNVLFIGGNVRWCTSRNIGPDGDDIFLNRNNEVAAGVSRDDIVLGAADARPTLTSGQCGRR